MKLITVLMFLGSSVITNQLGTFSESQAASANLKRFRAIVAPPSRVDSGNSGYAAASTAQINKNYSSSFSSSRPSHHFKPDIEGVRGDGFQQMQEAIYVTLDEKSQDRPSQPAHSSAVVISLEQFLAEARDRVANSVFDPNYRAPQAVALQGVDYLHPAFAPFVTRYENNSTLISLAGDSRPLYDGRTLPPNTLVVDAHAYADRIFYSPTDTRVPTDNYPTVDLVGLAHTIAQLKPEGGNVILNTCYTGGATDDGSKNVASQLSALLGDRYKIAAPTGALVQGGGANGGKISVLGPGGLDVSSKLPVYQSGNRTGATQLVRYGIPYVDNRTNSPGATGRGSSRTKAER